MIQGPRDQEQGVTFNWKNLVNQLLHGAGIFCWNADYVNFTGVTIHAWLFFSGSSSSMLYGIHTKISCAELRLSIHSGLDQGTSIFTQSVQCSALFTSLWYQIKKCNNNNILVQRGWYSDNTKVILNSIQDFTRHWHYEGKPFFVLSAAQCAGSCKWLKYNGKVTWYYTFRVDALLPLQI